MNNQQKALAVGAVLFSPIFYGTWLFYLAFMDIKRNLPLYKEKLGAAFYGLYPWFALALILDVLFNWTVGTIYFQEFPREFLFTSRCHRHLSSTGTQLARAHFMCTNLLDPADMGHCG